MVLSSHADYLSSQTITILVLYNSLSMFGQTVLNPFSVISHPFFAHGSIVGPISISLDDSLAVSRCTRRSCEYIIELNGYMYVAFVWSV